MRVAWMMSHQNWSLPVSIQYSIVISNTTFYVCSASFGELLPYK